MKNTSNSLTAFSIYINFMFKGVATIILAQNMSSLMTQLNTDESGVAFVISAIGFGRMSSVFITGYLSDKVGRKPLLIAGMCFFIIFFIGILFSTNVWMAAFFTFFVGIANALMDTGTYPALVELFPKAQGSVTVLLRTFIALGQFILPLIVSFLAIRQLYFGYSFLLFAFLLVINIFIMIKQPFTPPEEDESDEDHNKISNVQFSEKPKFKIEGLCLIGIGFTSPATFNIIVKWLPTYAEQVTGMGELEALRLISIYSFFSFFSIILTSILVKKSIKPITLILVYTFISLISLIVLQIHPTPFMSLVIAIFIGFFASAGIFQLALVTLLELFPDKKGSKTAMTSMAAAISVTVVPIVTGLLVAIDVYHVMTFNIFITAIGVILAAIVKIRYSKLTSNSHVNEVI